MNPNVLGVTAIAEVFPDGQKITAAVVEFDREIDTRPLSPSQFSVRDRTVTKAYANVKPARSAKGENGKYVVIELSLEDAEAQVLPEPIGSSPMGPGGHGGQFPQIPLRVRKPLKLMTPGSPGGGDGHAHGGHDHASHGHSH